MKLDKIYSAIANRKLFFAKGWGRRDVLAHILTLGTKRLNQNLASRKLPKIQMSWGENTEKRQFRLRKAVFESPFEFHWKDGKTNRREILPHETSLATVQFVFPNKTQSPRQPIVIHFAATGDEGFTRRLNFIAAPLARIGIASAILENPYYGSRRPTGQRGSLLQTFSEFLEMSRAAQDEGLALIEYLQEKGYGPIGVTGISMGGYIALATAAQSKIPVAVAACLPCHSAGPVYTKGVLSRACDWSALSTELGLDDTDTRIYMNQILELSNLCSRPAPKFASAAVLVGAIHDEYIDRESTELIHKHWKGSELRWVNGDHVSSVLLQTEAFRSAIKDSLERFVHRH